MTPSPTRAAREQRPHRPEPVERARLVPARADHREGEERSARSRARRRASSAPSAAASPSSSTQTTSADRREEVEHPVREHRPDQRRPDGRAPRQAPGQHRDARRARRRGPAARRSPNRPTQNAEKTSRKPGRGGPDRLPDHRVPGERADDDRGEVQPDRRDHPGPADDGERVPDDAPVGPAPPDQRRWRARAGRPARAAASGRPSRRDPLVDRLEPARHVRPRVALLGERAGREAHPHAAVLVARAARRPPRRAPRRRRAARARRRRAPRPSANPGMFEATTGVATRERLDQHHPEALAAERGRDEQLRRPRARGRAPRS